MTLLKFLEENHINDLTAIIGGLLGFWVFIDSYLLSFKPQILISSRVVFNLATNNKHNKYLDNIAFTVSISNKRKKYGVVNDLAVRLYVADEINPQIHTYFVSEIACKVIHGNDILTYADRKEFTPITTPEHSNNSFTLMFGNTIFNNKSALKLRKNYFIEVFYKKRSNSKWLLIKKIYIHSERNPLAIEGDKWSEWQEIYSTLNYKDSREILHNMTTSETSIYKGAIHKFTDKLINSLKLAPASYLNRVKRLLDFPLAIVKIKYLKIKNRFILLPIIKKYNTNNKPGIQVIFGNPAARPFINDGIATLKGNLLKLAENLNIEAPVDREIKIIDQGEFNFMICRYRMSLSVNNHNDSIQIAETNAHFGHSKIRLSFTLKKLRKDKYFWVGKDQKITTLESIAIQIMDFLVVHDHG